MRTFPNEGGYDELIVTRDIGFMSLCEEHLLPFVGVAHIGYVPAGRLLGRSGPARVLELFARCAQVQARLAERVADWLDRELVAKGCGVVLAAEHRCTSPQPGRAGDTHIIITVLRGALRDDAPTRERFFSIVGERHRRHRHM